MRLRIITNGVKLKAVAFKNAYKTSNPQEFFTTMHRGYYGDEELSRRYVRAQKNTISKQDEQPLSEDECEAVEVEFFEWAKIKFDNNTTLISKEFERVNTYHRGAITAAQKSVRRANISADNLNQNRTI